MPDCQVTCTTKSVPNGGHEHITHIGGIGGNGWRLTKAVAINRIDGRIDFFYTIDRVTGVRADVGVVREPGITPFLRTYADGIWNNNLVALPQCPNNYAVIE